MPIPVRFNEHRELVRKGAAITKMTEQNFIRESFALGAPLLIIEMKRRKAEQAKMLSRVRE